MKDNYISAPGLEKLHEELTYLTTVERPEVVDRISKARDLGDLSENAEYHDAREKQSFIEGRVQEIESLIKNAVIIEKSKKQDKVEIGSTVHATCDNGAKIKYTIVGPSEADPASGLISHESPLGRAFIGKAVGHDIELSVPAGKVKCVVDKIE